MTTIYLKDQLEVAHVLHIASLMYDYVYDKLDVLFKKYNPCAVRNDTCISGRNGCINFCCDGCKHLSENGCTVKALSCKFFLCSHCIESDVFMKECNKLYQIAEETWCENLL